MRGGVLWLNGKAVPKVRLPDFVLPMAANTLTGITQVPADVVDAARGMGLTNRQILWQIELKLALPVILTAIRIVLFPEATPYQPNEQGRAAA